MTASSSKVFATLAAVALLGACSGGDESGGPAGETTGGDAAPSAGAGAQELPDTTVDAVWAHLQAEDYRSWSRWPGTEALYSGGEPHGMLLTTYLNRVALDALQGGEAEMPVGAIIVKENYMPDSVLAAVTAMYKTEGFNPDHANWWFLKRNADGSVDVGGRGAGCENCHGGRAANDYLFTGTLGGRDGAGAGGGTTGGDG